YNTGFANSGNVNTGAFNGGNYNNGFLWRGDNQGQWGTSYTMSIPDTAIPVNVRVPIFLDIPISGTLGTITVLSFNVPSVTVEATLVGIGVKLVKVNGFTIPNISINLPAIGLNIGAGPG
ncbi:hypothetical protein, partial [Mycobacterium paraintracellulare]